MSATAPAGALAHRPCARRHTRQSLGGRPVTRGALATAAAAARPDYRPVSFPRDYAELVRQCADSLVAAQADGVLLQEVQLPVAGLDSVSGDVEGNVETNITVRYLRQLLDAAFKRDGSQANTRVFFPDKLELALARGGAGATSDGVPAPDVTFAPAQLGDWPGPLTHIWEPSVFTLSGLSRLMNQHPLIEKRTAVSDVRFVVAYPSHNIDEMCEVAELHERVAQPTNRPIIVVNGELERVRSGYYPAFWSRKEMDILRAFCPRFEQIYYIHNFKGRYVYPAPTDLSPSRP